VSALNLMALMGRVRVKSSRKDPFLGKKPRNEARTTDTTTLAGGYFGKYVHPMFASDNNSFKYQ